MTTETNTRPIQLVLELPDRQQMAALLSMIDDNGVTADTAHICCTESDGAAVVDLSRLTRKQRRTLELALETGYYEQPRTADLTDLAERLSISKSAVSQRLRGAEAALVEDLFGRST